MRFWLFAAFLVIFAEYAANGTKTTKKCNQYIGQGAVTSDAIKKLDEKLDQLIKLLQPSPYAGNLRIYIFSAVARPNGQPRQAGVARGVRGHAPHPPRNFEL